MKKLVIISVATVAVLTFSGCGNKSDEGSKNVVTEAATKAVETTKEAAAKTTEAVKETAQKAAEATKEVASKAAEATKEAASKATEAAKETAQKAAEATKEAASKATEAASGAMDKAKEAASGGNAKGKELYAKCVSCHGADGKTKALGKSEVIAGQSAADLEKKISEYKAGTRNVAGMGMLMKGQVSSLSDEDIKAIAEYISSLK